MKNRYFDENMLAVLLQSRRWRLVSPAMTDIGPVSSRRHLCWMPSHQHKHLPMEVMIALKGKTVYSINNRIYPCPVGSVFVFDPNIPHDRGYPPWTPAITHLWISFLQDKAMARIVINRHDQPREKCNIHCLLDLKDVLIWQKGLAPSFQEDLPKELIRLRFMAALMDVIAVLVEEGYRETAVDQHHAFQREKIEAICRHIEETGGADASLDNLAQIAGYSKFHFLRLFRQYAGQSVHAYVNQARRRKVEALLGRGLTRKTISAELGFSCLAAFSRWYRPFRQQLN
jgi:AraC-like DNA-binding protein